MTEKICKRCGKSFVPAHANMDYCSPECRQAVLREYRMGWYRENRDREVKKQRDKRAGKFQIDPEKVRYDCNGFDEEKHKCVKLRMTYCGFEDCNWYAPRETGKTPKGALKRCEWCGKYFEVKHHGSTIIYCSPECRRKGRNLKVRLNKGVKYEKTKE